MTISFYSQKAKSFILHHTDFVRFKQSASSGILRLYIRHRGASFFSDNLRKQSNFFVCRKQKLRSRAMHLCHKSHDTIIQSDMTVFYVISQSNTFKRTTTTQRHIRLSMGKNSRTQINNHFVKGLSLTLVNSHRSRKRKWQLSK